MALTCLVARVFETMVFFIPFNILNCRNLQKPKHFNKIKSKIMGGFVHLAFVETVL